jgi:hypothetical protein
VVWGVMWMCEFTRDARLKQLFFGDAIARLATYVLDFHLCWLNLNDLVRIWNGVR